MNRGKNFGVWGGVGGWGDNKCSLCCPSSAESTSLFLIDSQEGLWIGVSEEGSYFCGGVLAWSLEVSGHRYRRVFLVCPKDSKFSDFLCTFWFCRVKPFFLHVLPLPVRKLPTLMFPLPSYSSTVSWILGLSLNKSLPFISILYNTWCYYREKRLSKISSHIWGLFWPHRFFWFLFFYAEKSVFCFYAYFSVALWALSRWFGVAFSE